MLDRVLADWPLKLLALVLAFGVWLSVTGEQNVLHDFNVPLDVRLPQTRILTSPAPNTVTVRLRGLESRMRRLDSLAMEMRVDLSDSALGEQDVLLTSADLLGVPRGVEVEFVFPDRLRLQVDQRAQQELRVEPTFLGQPPEGFTFYGAKVRPERVQVEGPESEVRPLERITTNPIRLDLRRAPFTVRVGAVPDSPLVRVLNPRPLEVRVDVDAEPVERTFRGVPVEAAAPLRVTPAALDVVVAGPPALVERVTADQLRVSVEAPGLAAGAELELAPRVDFVDVPVEDLPRLSAKAIHPRRVSVRNP